MIEFTNYRKDVNFEYSQSVKMVENPGIYLLGCSKEV
jgi:hypothetical protein